MSAAQDGAHPYTTLTDVTQVEEIREDLADLGECLRTDVADRFGESSDA
jgi:hypothetical protein